MNGRSRQEAALVGDPPDGGIVRKGPIRRSRGFAVAANDRFDGPQRSNQDLRWTAALGRSRLDERPRFATLQGRLSAQSCPWSSAQHRRALTLSPEWPLHVSDRMPLQVQRRSGVRPFTPSPCGQPKAQQCSSCTVIWERWCTSLRSSRCSDCSSGRSPHIIF